MTPDRKLVYAVHLSKTTTSSNVAANITSGLKRTAVIEYSGVIEIAPDALSLVVAEGSKVCWDSCVLSLALCELFHRT